MAQPRYVFRFSEGFDLMSLAGTIRDEIDEVRSFIEVVSDDDEGGGDSEPDLSPRIGYRELVGDLARPETAGVSTVNVYFWFEELDDIGPAFGWRKSSSFQSSSLVGVLKLVLEGISAVTRPFIEVDLDEGTVVLDMQEH